jgi:hypothetical protein
MMLGSDYRLEETEGSVDDLEGSLSLDHLRTQRLALRERYEFAAGLDSRGVPKHTKPEPF